jgi:hypothetical protein
MLRPGSLLHGVVDVILTQLFKGGRIGVFVEHHLHQEMGYRPAGLDAESL